MVTSTTKRIYRVEVSCSLARSIYLSHTNETLFITEETMVLTSFSLVRNWYRLVSRSKDQLNEDLKFFQAIRFFTFCLVVVGHCGDLFTASSFANTQDREAEYYSPLGHVLINGSIIVQSFFEMSGFLLSIHFCTTQAKMKRISWIAILVTVGYRYIR